jgi:hypothetical protein
MRGRVATEAERDEIIFMIATGVTAKLLVMDFKVGSRPAQLATPAISL